MLIARMIADSAQLETRLEAMREKLAEKHMMVASVAMVDHQERVVEILLPGGDVQYLASVLDVTFSQPDMLVSDRLVELPQLFVSDMDSTMIGQECIDELADFAGLKDQVSSITERAMLGELDFEEALRARVRLLAELDAAAIARCLEERITVMPGASTLVGTLRSLGCRTVLVTGGFHHFADEVAAWLGFDRVVGNRLAVVNGVLTGELEGPVVDSATKLAVLRDESEGLLEGALTMASGDGANDIPMLEAADFGFAFHAKPTARMAANGVVNHGDLTAILELLGIPRSRWVEQ